jgi:hypothetical protein
MTTLNESFNTADNATLGPDLAWTDVNGDFQVVGNKASPATDAVRNISVANTALSSTDHYVEVVVVPQDANAGAGPICRAETGAQTHYWLALVESDQELILNKTVAGTPTTLTSKSFTVTPSNSYTLKIEAIGTAIKGYVNGTLELSATDSELSTQVRGGIRTFPVGAGIATFDSFVATDDLGGDVQLLAPIQDISAGTWLPSAGSPAELFAMIDGEKSPDEDYDYTSSAGTMEVKFAPGSTPSVQTGHTLRYRLRGNGTCDAVIKLKVGTTVVSQWTETNVPAVDTDYSHTLDSSPSFSITDYTDLRISVEAVP